MQTIGITGAEGFVGAHLRFLLHEHKDSFNVVLIRKDDFGDDENLSTKLRACDAVVHLAGLNRGDEAEIYDTNVGLTRRTLDALERAGRTATIIFLSSTHNVRDTAYGKSKRYCQKMISEWGKRNQRNTVSIVAPNIFGEFVRPYYNSAVATFCYELAEKKQSTINHSAQIELAYVKDVCGSILDILKMEKTPDTRTIHGSEMKLSDVYDLLKRFRDDYCAGIIPSLADMFELRMFNTFRSYLYPSFFPVALDPKGDSRGCFIEIAKSRVAGQTSFSTTHPGIVRGNHYHTRKIERFCVVEGEAIIRLRKLFSDRILEYRVCGEEPVFVDMPTYYTHSIENVGRSELLTTFWINEIFDSRDPDTFPEKVLP